MLQHGDEKFDIFGYSDRMYNTELPQYTVLLYCLMPHCRNYHRDFVMLFRLKNHNNGFKKMMGWHVQLFWHCHCQTWLAPTQTTLASNRSWGRSTIIQKGVSFCQPADQRFTPRSLPYEAGGLCQRPWQAMACHQGAAAHIWLWQHSHRRWKPWPLVHLFWIFWI